MGFKKAMLVGLLYAALAVLIGFVAGCRVKDVGAVPRLPRSTVCGNPPVVFIAVSTEKVQPHRQYFHD
jgi:hypothetical protein